jgi:hypothetical protein
MSRSFERHLEHVMIGEFVMAIGRYAAGTTIIELMEDFPWPKVSGAYRSAEMRIAAS